MYLRLSKEELEKIIPRIIEGDDKAFELFQEAFDGIVKTYAKKWFKRIKATTSGMYDFEDLEQELWMRILHFLPKYNIEKSKPSTWLYMVCEHGMVRLNNHYSRHKRSAHDNEGNTLVDYSLDYELGTEDGDLKLIDTLVDPLSFVEERAIGDLQAYEYVYIIKNFLSSLKYPEHKLMYLHMVQGRDQTDSANIIGCTRQNVSRVRANIISKTIWYKDNGMKIDYAKAIEFTGHLLSDKNDVQLSEELKTDLATIKICREILAAVDLYDIRRKTND